MAHLKRYDVESFVSGRLTEKPRQRVLKHLLGGCPECLGRFHAALKPQHLYSTSVPATAEEYDAAIGRALAQVRLLEERWREDQEKCERGLAALREGGWRQFRKEKQALQDSWGNAEMLLRLSFEARYRDPEEMLQFAESALMMVGRLEPERYGSVALYRDFQARVWTELANACRVKEQFWRVESALNKACEFLDQGTGDLMIAARVNVVAGAFYKDQRKFGKAEEILDLAYRIYLKLGQRHLAGRVLISKGLNLVYAEQQREAIAYFEQGLAMVDVARDPQLFAAAHHNLLLALTGERRFQEASELLLKSGLRKVFARDPLNLLRLRGIEAMILAGRGRLVEAERAFGQIQEGFSARRLDLPAAVVGMERAKVLLQMGCRGEAHELSLDLYRRAQERNLSKAAVTAILTFEVACRYKKAEPEHAERVRRFLDRHQHDRHLRWEPEMLFG